MFFPGANSLFSPIFTLVVLVFLGMFAYSIIKGMAEWSDNNAQPVLSTLATIVSKRAHVSSSGSSENRSTWTTYFCTFELEDGSRREFKLGANEYGLLAEGDRGQLRFQGTRYLGFQR